MKKSYFYFLIFSLIFLFIFRSLVFNIKNNLLDRGDYAFVIWQMNQSIEKIKTLNFSNFFETNAFYPNKLTLFFSDIFLPQAIIALPLSFFFDNPILTFNFVFIITFLLNYLSSFLFWRQIFKKDIIGFWGALFTVFSPFFHIQLGHFQMQSYWLFFFTLYFIFKNKEKENTSNVFLAGIFLAFQFLASVYLSIFLIFTIFLYFFLEFFYLHLKSKFNSVKNFFIIILVFLIIDGIFIKGYLDVKKIYNFKRDVHEYILYSAHLSDYFFTTSINSVIHKSSLLNKWNRFDRHNIGEKASFSGFLLFFLALWGIFSFNFKQDGYRIYFSLTKDNFFFTFLILIGFWFSLGPRINFNGNYAHIPTVYNLLIKYIPLSDSIRSLARWSFLYYLGIVYFAIKGCDKIYRYKKLKAFLFIFILLFFVLEYMPLNLRIYSINYLNPVYQELRNKCLKEKKILLEYPVTHFDVKGGIIKGLEYITNILVSSLYHKCYLINGYSGYDPIYLRYFNQSLNTYIKENNYKKIEDILKKNNVFFLKINKNSLIDYKLSKKLEKLKEKINNIEVIISND